MRATAGESASASETKQEKAWSWMRYDWPAWISRPRPTATTTQSVQPKQQQQHIHFQEHEHTTDPGPAPSASLSHSPNEIDDATGPSPRLRRWSTVQQRRLSTDQLTLNGKIMQQRRQRVRAKKAKAKEKKERKANRKAAISDAGGLNTATIKSKPSPSKMTGLLGDWKLKVWRRSQWRAMSV